MWLLHVAHTFHLHFVHHREPRHITAMLEGVKSWLLPGGVPDKPCCSILDFVQEGEVFVGGAAPRKA
ncbi:hypothetical protein E2C01_074500 [Portunus trituberculatus]|uniref:Uncharacterized protein n=1 Tax=Portunus trituberculatus TaxID=210409 RepID=A0A5B7I3I5_PORTR|nr:hypothetical protein [Portunus trituberculatus]